MKMKYYFAALLLLIQILITPWSIFAQVDAHTTLMDAVVTTVKTVPRESKQMTGDKVIRFRIVSGTFKGKEFSSTVDISRASFGGYRPGDQVIVSYSKDPTGRETVYVVDYNRKQQLLILFFLFLAFVFIIGRWKGISSFIGMIFSFVIIGRFIIPNILLGNDPVLISLLGAIFIIPVTFYLSHGINRKTTIAVVGTFLALVLTGVLAFIFIQFARLTGFAAEEAAYLDAMKGTAINIKNILLAGIIIGALGVLDDITISQTSIVAELHNANAKYSFKQLYNSAMSVGRDHIASLVNTLVLVYVGASLPLFLLFYNTQFSYTQVISQEIIATEIIRTLVSSIGIIAAVPITTLLACLYTKKGKS
jgi:uncharacterized membrane protein